MKIRWTGEPRALADPQVEVEPGDELEIDDDAGKSLIEQGLATRVAKSSPKKEDS